MGSSTSSFPDAEPPAREQPGDDGSFATLLPPPPHPPDLVFGDPGDFWRREPKRRYIILFALTLITTTLTGAEYFASFEFGFAERLPTEISRLHLIVNGLWYSLAVLAILGAHEFGHYFACVYYRVNASLPYFIPFPGFLTGTLGAVIRIRQPIPGKRALFDIGIAGPIAGFVIAAPTLLVGMMLSKVITIPSTFKGGVTEFGEPLLLKAVAWFVFGSIPDGQTIVLHPLGFAAWFGMLATALNLFPIGQLDGGHISYAVFGRRSTIITLVAVACLGALAVFVSSSWIVWTVLTVVMLLAFGPRHPRVFDEDVPLDRGRIWLAVFALLMFVVCFTPAPIELRDLIGKH
jgi:membrane-associated protease RseP (regulator of RpoE activity)